MVGLFTFTAWTAVDALSPASVLDLCRGRRTKWFQPRRSRRPSSGSIPGINDGEDHLREIARLAERLDNLRQVDLEPCNPLDMGKYERLGRMPPLELMQFPSREQVETWRSTIASATLKPVTVP